MLILNSGPSENFCKNKANGKYANPKNPQQFFSCTNKVGSICQLCAATLIYKQECDRCLRPSDSCTTSKPETRPTNASQEQRELQFLQVLNVSKNISLFFVIFWIF